VTVFDGDIEICGVTFFCAPLHISGFLFTQPTGVQVVHANKTARLSVSQSSVFDRPGPLTTFFANPFALGCDPALWRELQSELKIRFDQGISLEDAFLELSLSTQMTSAFVHLTEEQLAEVEQLMCDCDKSLNFDTASWLLSDCLLRASRAAARLE
jgi:hypothetical protein